jgi:hypothetical protein
MIVCILALEETNRRQDGACEDLSPGRCDA